MERRDFIRQSSLLTAMVPFRHWLPPAWKSYDATDGLYGHFKNPRNDEMPFVRWWWNGDKVEKNELARELRLLKDAGIGGVEINPVRFPDRTDDLGKPSVPWLSDEWIDLLQFATDEAKSLGMVCDLIVGSGWPFGAEWLNDDERSQILVIGARKLEGPLDYEVSLFDLFKEADPSISSPFPGRKMEMLSVTLAPAYLNSIEETKDLSAQIPSGTIRFTIPDGKFVLYALVKIRGFMKVIQGAPGATGPVLDHYNPVAVRKYLTRMSDRIQQRTGPLSSRFRALFTDSMELEGANWCDDLPAEFAVRRGYDIVPFLPYILYKTGAMGNTWSYDHGAEFSPAFRDRIRRMRYDFEQTKTELLEERFAATFVQWCRDNNVQSRMQAYGRGYFPVEGSFDPDIPEAETWIRKGLGHEMSGTDYATGRGYTMVNKFVSSAAHLSGKKQISCEELTNIHQVFNETLDLMKVAGDLSIISGTTHPVFHGFNYSPPSAPFPGWVIYGTYINEQNPWWPFFKYFTSYKSRLTALLQQGVQFADIAILAPTADLWSIYGAQNDPFPAVMHPDWLTFIWEAIHQNGCGCDYVSEKVIAGSTMQNGYMQYGARKYHTLLLAKVESVEAATLKKLVDFAEAGGRIFCIDAYPEKSAGWKDHEAREGEVKSWLAKLQDKPYSFFLVDKPGQDHTGWFKALREEAKIPAYLQISDPVKFISQVRYQCGDKEVIFIHNASLDNGYEISIKPSDELTRQRHPWIWDPETGERYRLEPKTNWINLQFGPAESKLLVFDKNKKGLAWEPAPPAPDKVLQPGDPWRLSARHVDGSSFGDKLERLTDLKEMPKWINFAGTIFYTNFFQVEQPGNCGWIDLGKAWGVTALRVNGKQAGVKWYGRRVFDIRSFLIKGENEVEIQVTTTVGNYLKNQKDNKIGQYWTNEGRTIQPLQPMGLEGPVFIY